MISDIYIPCRSKLIKTIDLLRVDCLAAFEESSNVMQLILVALFA